MKPSNNMLMLVGCWIFSIGFVASGSGWGWMIGQLMDDRPEWSVCGLEMCSCVPTTAAEPECPLCETGEMETCDDEPAGNAPVRRVPFMKKMDSVGYASSSMLVSAFVLVSIGHWRVELVAWDQDRWAIAEGFGVPRGPAVGVPTPPPRIC